MYLIKLDTSGFALEDSKVYIYYGAADTVVALAETTIEEFINACNKLIVIGY